MVRKTVHFVIFFLFGLHGPDCLGEEEGANREALLNTVKALQQIQPQSIQQSPLLKEKVISILNRMDGWPEMIELAARFNLHELDGPVLNTALEVEDLKTAVDGVRFVLEGGQEKRIRAILEKDNDQAAKLARLVGLTRMEKGVELLGQTLDDEKQSVDLRRAVIAGLVETRLGAKLLLSRLKETQLPPSLTGVAGERLRTVRWAEIAEETTKLLPAPQNRDSQPLPPLSELVSRRGDPARGKEVFNQETTLCSSCHRVRGEGQDFGPDLSEIGDKLGREAFYDAILNPSSGISFGYEAWSIELKNGEEAFGLIISDEENKLVLKQQAGITVEFPKSDVVNRIRQPMSIMPTGLQMAMTTQDLVDLVEYLVSLKKSDTK